MWIATLQDGRISRVKESVRDSITGQLTLDYLVQRAAQGWRVASIEWVRETEDANAAVEGPPSLFVDKQELALPYGLQVSPTSSIIEENPLEAKILVLILEQIIEEKRITEIATLLNAQGYRMREGSAWSASAVFELLPRLVEAGPALLKSAEWEQRRVRGRARPN